MVISLNKLPLQIKHTMRQLLLILLILVISSCVTQKRCNSKFPPQISYIKKDSIIYKDKIVYRDTIIYKTLTKDSIIRDTKIVYVNDTAWFSPMVAYGKYGWAMAWSYRGNAFMKYFEGGMTIEINLKNAIQERDHWKEMYEIAKTKQVVTQNSPFARFAIGFFWGFIAIVLVGVVLSILFVRFKK